MGSGASIQVKKNPRHFRQGFLSLYYPLLLHFFKINIGHILLVATALTALARLA
jgi:hypothetical protein